MYAAADPASLTRLVHEFYADVRRDALLAAVFGPRIGDDWDAHLARMAAFWSDVMLGRRPGVPPFQGNVYGRHMTLEGVTPAHFQRWLDLFDATARRLFETPVADELLVVAKRIAASLQYGFFGKVEVAGPSA
ncbi:group III truncated hemoglobin [Pseudoduganella sp. SL102]|uniref:group III truncated hemoglobin n=1 Tax=Pseudoduganella sp. SL102 TaxID=2995154 RepID=UPI00248BFC10|nr:group III truncated hemoglobin [Pseudoduganella sp. SL102]WBS00994.1 group III truncated hemoglobin [Pseudoduganella sp. SL102]